ncbi:MAG: hypothetical protein DPW09_28030 [Anaerolineae bacterium]|nr:hypothetical protein [Anaerolineales bacterium]MCQ3977297.1 hypothetical protein [Anaerolineae bacterium]
MSQPAYNIRAIRKLLTAAFETDEGLRQFCTDFPELRPVTERFSSGMGKDQMIQRLIEYCESKVLTMRLLELVKEDNLAAYAQYENQIFPGEKPQFGAEIMPDTSAHLKTLLSQKTRELYDLQEKAAKFGALHTPSYITLQIQDLEKEIANLQQQLAARH